MAKPKWYTKLQKKYGSPFGWRMPCSDHVRFEGEAYISEPYACSLSNLQDLIDFCLENRLDFRVDGEAKHHPDCVRIVVTPLKQ